jgi:AcrR family transcriptional regulator
MIQKPLDRRVQRTRQILQEALIALILEKGYEAVTVQDIIDRANVGRSTFYSHFRDQEELLLSEFEKLWAEFEKHMAAVSASDTDPWDLSTLIFKHAQHYLRLYKAVVGRQSWHIMESYFYARLTSLIREQLQSRWRGKQKDFMPVEVVTHHLVTSLIALLIWWLDNDLPYPAERMADLYRQLTKPGIDLEA